MSERKDKESVSCQPNLDFRGNFNIFVHASEKAMCVQEKVAVSESTQAAHNVSIDEKHVRLYSFCSLVNFLVCFFNLI